VTLILNCLHHAQRVLAIMARHGLEYRQRLASQVVAHVDSAGVSRLEPGANRVIELLDAIGRRHFLHAHN
jgi:hypothetical protein